MAPRDGRVDVYPKVGHFATSAMAEGAVEGEAQRVMACHSGREGSSRLTSGFQLSL